MKTACWIREDLRLLDNTALSKASSRASNGMIAFYVISPQDFKAHDMAPIRIDFLIQHLEALQHALLERNIPLYFIDAIERHTIPALVADFCEQHQIDILYYNEQYEIDEQRRDSRVQAELAARGIAYSAEVDQVLLAPGTVLTKEQHYYTVFTPFKRQALRILENTNFRLYPAPAIQPPIKVKPAPIPASFRALADPRVRDRWPAGENAAHAKLNDFVATRATEYQAQRDFPALPGTSQLSPYLAAGVLSVRQCFNAARAANSNDLQHGNTGLLTWINELLWREFYKHITVAFPRVCMNRPFKLEWEKFQWDNNESVFQAWCEGRTGYPLVDAAMRQLNETGWMHNRLRMVTAMFLTKDGLIDWRWGERYFMQHLIDGDFAANNGGWQWSAGCGTDAAPYFRVFNPITQSERFDPQGDFINMFCPELNAVDTRIVHFPDPLSRVQHNYPPPIVDHNEARLRFLARYKQSLGG